MAEEKTATTTEQKSKKGLIAGIVAAVAAVIIIVVCVFVFAKPSVVGKYTLSAFISNGKESTEMVDFVKALGGEYTVEFKKDKTGTLKMGMGDESEEINFTYTDKEIKATDEGEEKTMKYEFNSKDKTVTLTVDDESMKFTRKDD